MSCPNGYIKWIYRVFGDCIITNKDKISFGIGMVSNFLWIICSMPQIYHNYKTKRVQGFSPFYFTLMFIADTFSLTGAILTKALITQIITGTIYVTIDCILLFQFSIYGGWECEKSDNEVLTTESSYTNGILPIIITTAYSFDFSYPYKGKLLFGTISGWIGTSLYLGSRILQLLKNLKRRYISDFSQIYLFLIILANLTYSTSVFIRDLSLNYLWKQLPWIIGSIFPMFFDITTTIQLYLWGNSLPNNLINPILE